MGGVSMGFIEEQVTGLVYFGHQHWQALEDLPGEEVELGDEAIHIAAFPTFSEELEREVWVVCGVQRDGEGFIYLPLSIVDEKLLREMRTPRGMREAA